MQNPSICVTPKLVMVPEEPPNRCGNSFIGLVPHTHKKCARKPSTMFKHNEFTPRTIEIRCTHGVIKISTEANVFHMLINGPFSNSVPCSQWCLFSDTEILDVISNSASVEFVSTQKKPTTWPNNLSFRHDPTTTLSSRTRAFIQKTWVFRQKWNLSVRTWFPQNNKIF